MITLDLLPLLLPAVILGLFVAALYQQREQWTLSLRILGGVKVSRGGARVCPHLGLTDDPFTHLDVPSETHRCYLWMQRDQIDLSHQKGFCLSAAHTACPWLAVRPAQQSGSPFERALPALRATWSATSSGARMGWAIARGLAVAFALWTAQQARVTAHAARQAASWVWVRLQVGGAHAAALQPHATALAAGAGSRLLRAAAMLAHALLAIVIASAHLVRGVGRRSVPLIAAVFHAATAAMVAPVGLVRRLGSLRLPAPRLASPALARAARPDQPVPQPVELVSPVAPPFVAIAQPAAALPRRRTKPVVGDVAALPAAVLLAEGIVLLERGDYEEAYQRFYAATHAAPSDARAWFWRAKTAPELPEVILCLQEALSFDPGNSQLSDNLAWAQQRLERAKVRQRLGQPLPAGRTIPVVTAPGPRARAATTQHPPPMLAVARELARVAACVSCFGLAAYWFVATMVPLSQYGLIPLPESLAMAAPALVWAAGPQPLPEVLPGYRLLAGLPPTLSFLALFCGLGLAQRNTWVTPWSFVAAVISTACAMAAGAPSELAGFFWVAMGITGVLWWFTPESTNQSPQSAALQMGRP